MYKLKYEVEDQSISTKYLEGNTMVIVNISPISQTTLPEAQTELLLDFNIRQTIDQQKKWSAYQHTLRSIFTNNIVACQMIPNCILKVNMFIVMSSENVEAAIINAAWASFLKMGIPMQKSIWALSKQKHNVLVFNMFNPEEVIYGQCSQQLMKQSIIQKIEEYKTFIIERFHVSIH